MTKALTVVAAILMVLSPMLGASASGEYFYNSVMPAAEDRATEKPLATPAQCLDQPKPGGTGTLNFHPVAYEVNGQSYCGVNTFTKIFYDVWNLNISSGTRVKIRYATRDTDFGLYTCLTS